MEVNTQVLNEWLTSNYLDDLQGCLSKPASNHPPRETAILVPTLHPLGGTRGTEKTRIQTRLLADILIYLAFHMSAASSLLLLYHEKLQTILQIADYKQADRPSVFFIPIIINSTALL